MTKAEIRTLFINKLLDIREKQPECSAEKLVAEISQWIIKQFPKKEERDTAMVAASLIWHPDKTNDYQPDAQDQTSQVRAFLCSRKREDNTIVDVKYFSQEIDLALTKHEEEKAKKILKLPAQIIAAVLSAALTLIFWAIGLPSVALYFGIITISGLILKPIITAIANVFLSERNSEITGLTAELLFLAVVTGLLLAANYMILAPLLVVFAVRPVLYNLVQVCRSEPTGPAVGPEVVGPEADPEVVGPDLGPDLGSDVERNPAITPNFSASHNKKDEKIGLSSESVKTTDNRLKPSMTTNADGMD